LSTNAASPSIARSGCSAPTALALWYGALPTTRTTHRFAHDAAVLECLRNLGEITHQHFYLIALPLCVKGLDARPVRAIAVEEV
jgi:kynurenine formamidase